MTQQKLYYKVKTHLLRQKAKAHDGTFCRYRDPYGRKCAIGCLIPDHLYDPAMESRTVRSLTYFPNMNRVFPAQAIPLLIDLQKVHDHSLPEEWLEKLHEVASKHGLKA